MSQARAVTQSSTHAQVVNSRVLIHNKLSLPSTLATEYCNSSKYAGAKEKNTRTGPPQSLGGDVRAACHAAVTAKTSRHVGQGLGMTAGACCGSQFFSPDMPVTDLTASLISSQPLCMLCSISAAMGLARSWDSAGCSST